MPQKGDRIVLDGKAYVTNAAKESQGKVLRSSVKSYAKLVEEGRPLAPKKRPGSKLKMFMAISSPLYIMVRASQSRCVWVGG